MPRASNESHFVEFFCGRALLTKAFREIGCRTRAFDVDRHLPWSLSLSLCGSLSLSLSLACLVCVCVYVRVRVCLCLFP